MAHKFRNIRLLEKPPQNRASAKVTRILNDITDRARLRAARTFPDLVNSRNLPMLFRFLLILSVTLCGSQSLGAADNPNVLVHLGR